MRRVPDEDRERWVAQMRALARRDAAELVPVPPFDVYGVAFPELRPAALAELQRADDRLEFIVLAYGDWAAPGGPYVAVTTSSAAADDDQFGEAALLRIMRQERRRAAEHADVDEVEPPEPPEYSPALLSVGGEQVGVLRGRYGEVQAARLAVGGLSVAVVGRGVDLASLRIAVVADLRPYLDGRHEMIGRLGGRRRPPPVLEPAEGIAAVRALVDASLARYADRESARRAGREPSYRAGEGQVMGALWQRAVAEQQRLSGAGRRGADDAVTLVVNHVSHLQQEAAWFTARPALREAAITQTLDYAVLGLDVPSVRAQQAWARYWAHHSTLGRYEPGAALFAALEELPGLLADWLRQWQAWADAN